MRKTKIEIMKEMELDNEVFDFALPQKWVDEVTYYLNDILSEEETSKYGAVVSNFVWLYDKDYTLFGRPCSLSEEGNKILSTLRDTDMKSLFLNGRFYKG